MLNFVNIQLYSFHRTKIGPYLYLRDKRKSVDPWWLLATRRLQAFVHFFYCDFFQHFATLLVRPLSSVFRRPLN